MKSITLVALYFGKIPAYFEVFLKSCEYNPTVDWLVFTDDRSNFSVPSNVTIIHMNMEGLIHKIEDFMGFKVNVPRPYKLTDFKPTYGLIFQEYLKNTDFWGFCDIDLVFGDIRKFVTDEMLDQNDKIFTRGHLTIFKNTPENNSVFQRDIETISPYKVVFTDPQHQNFDEWGKGKISINRLYEHYNIPMYDSNVFHDLNPRQFQFIPINFTDKTKYKGGGYYTWIKGRLFWNSLNDHSIKEEILYVHFQKRKMRIKISSGTEDILLVANHFFDLPNTPSLKKLLRSQKLFLLNPESWKFYYDGFKRKFSSKAKRG